MIREALARYIQARSAVLEARAERLRCAHEWKLQQQFERYQNNNIEDLLSLTTLYVCTKCGEHKKITMP